MRDMAPNKAMKLTSALAERADLLGVVCWRSARGRQEAPRRSQLIAGVRRTHDRPSVPTSRAVEDVRTWRAVAEVADGSSGGPR